MKIYYKKELNPNYWKYGKFDSGIREKLIQIAKDKMPVDECGKIGLTLIRDAFAATQEKVEKADSIMELFQKINLEKI